MNGRPHGIRRSSCRTQLIEPSRLWERAPFCPMPRTYRRSGRTSQPGATASAKSHRTAGTRPLYYDPDHNAPDKTYSKIGGWVREYAWDPLKWRMADSAARRRRHGRGATLGDCLHPRSAGRLRLPGPAAEYRAHGRHSGQRHGRREALHDGDARALPGIRPRTGGERHLRRAARRGAARDHARSGAPAWATGCPRSPKTACPANWPTASPAGSPTSINFHGPNFVCDAACASAMAAISAAAEGLIEHDFDVAVTGGIDRNMGASTFVKFCKIGALSATGSRPYAEGADGFVMGEGAAIFLMKRLADAERDGDKIYAVLRGIGGVERRQGKGHHRAQPRRAEDLRSSAPGRTPACRRPPRRSSKATAPPPAWAMWSKWRAWRGCSGSTASNGRPIALGSVKSNIGHLKGAAGAAGILKTVLALRDKVLPPSVRCEHPNPNIDFAHSPLYVNTELRPWTETADGVRRAGVSAFGFGGTNFHVVLEEYIPHRLTGNGKHSVAVARCRLPSYRPRRSAGPGRHLPARQPAKAPSARRAGDRRRLRGRTGRASARRPESRGGGPGAGEPQRRAEADLRAPERIAIDYAQCRRTGGQMRQSAQSAGVQPAGGVEGAARARHLPRPRSRAQGGVPLYRPGVAVRQHAAHPARGRADRGRAPSTRPTA